MAIILAVIVAIITVFLAFLQTVAHADGQRDDYSAGRTTLCIGLPIAALIAASHFLHMSW